MRIMTENYKDREFFIPLNNDKTEGLYCRPVSASARRKLALEAMREAGGDVQIAAHLENRKLLCAALLNWRGLYDMGGEEIPFSEAAINMICEHDPDAGAAFVNLIRNIARFGEAEDAKN